MADSTLSSSATQHPSVSASDRHESETSPTQQSAEDKQSADTVADKSHGAREKRDCKINTRLLPVKLYYFLFLSALASLLPFMAVYMKQLGLSPNETGILYGMMPFISFFVRPSLCALADRFKKHHLLLIVVTAIKGVTYMLLLYIPSRVLPAVSVNTQLNCNPENAIFKDCANTSGVLNPKCTYGMSDFADTIHNLTSTGNDTNYECKVHCSKVSESPVGICFSDSSEKSSASRCNETSVLDSTTLSLTLSNISRMLKNPVIDKSSNFTQCTEYNLRSMLYKGRPYERLFCDGRGTFDCQMTCKDLPSELCPTLQYGEEYDISFGLFFVIYLVGHLLSCPAFPLVDMATYDILGAENKHRFGEQRLWGTVGYALFGITITFVMYTMTDQANNINYSASFYLFAIMCSLAAVAAYFMKLSPRPSVTEAKRSSGGKMCCDFLSLVRQPKMFLFVLVMAYFGMSGGVVGGFLYWFLSDLGAPSLVFGFSLVITCAFEVPFFMISGFIINKIGDVACLYLALLGLALRHLANSLLVNPWLVLVIEPLHGVTYGLMWAAASHFANTNAPPEMIATVHGLISGLYYGIGKGIGSVLTGFLFRAVGGRWAFRVYSVLALCLLLVYSALNVFVFKTHSNRSEATSKAAKGADGCEDKQNGQPLLMVEKQPSKDQHV